MRLQRLYPLVLTLALPSLALAQGAKPQEDHAAHHPPASAAAAAAPASQPGSEAVDQQMRAMQDMHRKMLAAKTPAERAALMDAHMKLMQSGMAMMGRMGGMQDMQGMQDMMAMHQQMERRMALMEQMMQMMVDREAAMPRR